MTTTVSTRANDAATGSSIPERFAGGGGGQQKPHKVRMATQSILQNCEYLYCCFPADQAICGWRTWGDHCVSFAPQPFDFAEPAPQISLLNHFIVFSRPSSRPLLISYEQGTNNIKVSCFIGREAPTKPAITLRLRSTMATIKSSKLVQQTVKHHAITHDLAS